MTTGILVKKTHLVEKSAGMADKIKQLTVSGGEGDKSFLEIFCRPPALYGGIKKRRKGQILPEVDLPLVRGHSMFQRYDS